MKNLIIFGLLLTSVDSKSKPKVDYCKLTCKIGKEVYKSTGCNCKLPAGKREEYKDDVYKFRELMLKIHNELRNKTAMGDSGSELFPSSSNMNLVNYDLELEYVAHCYAGIITHGHDKCRATSKFPHVGQNLAYRSNHDYDQLVNRGPPSWFDEISLVKTDILDKFVHISGTGHFTQMVWAKTKYIGCVPIWNPDAPMPVYKNALICNYAPAGNFLGEPIYEKGKPCGSCPNDCNKKYPGLCGKAEPIPKDPRASATLTLVNRAILVILVLVHFI